MSSIMRWRRGLIAVIWVSCLEKEGFGNPSSQTGDSIALRHTDSINLRPIDLEGSGFRSRAAPPPRALAGSFNPLNVNRT
jgi:hypothetical protein